MSGKSQQGSARRLSAPIEVPPSQPVNKAEENTILNPNYGYASRRWLVSEMEGLPGLKA